MFLNMGTAMWGLRRAQHFKRVSRTPVDFEAKETFDPPKQFDGILAPLKAQRLLIKPEGERSWKWFTLFTKLELNLGDVVEAVDGKTYQVMLKEDWSDAGFFAYEITERANING